MNYDAFFVFLNCLEMYLFEMNLVRPCSTNNNWPVYSVSSILD